MKLPFLGIVEKRAKAVQSNFGVRSSPRPLLIFGGAVLVLIYLVMPGNVSYALSMALFLAPLWLPLILISGAWSLWIILKRSEFIASQKTLLLEIIPPRDVAKTPLAMETVLSGMHHSPGESNWYKKYIQGVVRPWWSLEMASIEGQVHFFIWTRAGFRRLIEAQLYAQYPGIQVVEAPDYTRRVTATSENGWAVWGCDFINTTGSDSLPIKTYVEYGLDKTQKEHEQVDPLANMIEFLGTMGKGEQLWLQLVIRVHKGEKYHKKNAQGKPYTWKDEATELIQKIRAETVSAEGGFPNPTKGQSEKMAAIERNVSKLPFDIGIRGIYLAKPDVFDPIAISGLTGIFKQFSSEGWNGLRPNGWMTLFDDYPWEFRVEKLKDKYRAWMINAYRRRQFFHEPFSMDTGVMSTEELATLYHIPSRAVQTPTLQRVQSATGEAPSNLPT